MMSSLMIQVLRKPKEFLIALMEKFGQLSQSADPDVSGRDVYVSFPFHHMFHSHSRVRY